MTTVGQRKRLVQDCVIRLLYDQLGSIYLGNWSDRPDNHNVESDVLHTWPGKRGYDKLTTERALRQSYQAAAPD
ncbi:hypothetical protein [Caldilinea sp.]|jgi:hypothetical protein|uniref:hypothetical protein n=1 Tax=Caldilinea sp. TaxID=2293560 RepID=UPI00261874EB|nr:hypothetical protein [uncultured Caldilinea sp.]